MVSATSEAVAELRARSTREAEHLRSRSRRCAPASTLAPRNCAATLQRGLLDIAEEVDVATTTTRDAASRVTVLTELTEAQRTQVEALLREVRADVVDAARALREELLTAHDGAARRARRAAGRRRAAADRRRRHARRRDGRCRARGRLPRRPHDARPSASTRPSAGFRTEWPTRTYEVVQGARAVAEGVVRDVRAEVGARLDDVRATLERGRRARRRSPGPACTTAPTASRRPARCWWPTSSTATGCSRPSATGCCTRCSTPSPPACRPASGSALAGRVTDAVARRRDARDAERYRAPLGEPVSPTAQLPEDVRTLGGAGAGAARRAPAPEAVVWHDREPEAGAAG